MVSDSSRIPLDIADLLEARRIAASLEVRQPTTLDEVERILFPDQPHTRAEDILWPNAPAVMRTLERTDPNKQREFLSKYAHLTKSLQKPQNTNYLWYWLLTLFPLDKLTELYNAAENHELGVEVLIEIAKAYTSLTSILGSKSGSGIREGLDTAFLTAICKLSPGVKPNTRARAFDQASRLFLKTENVVAARDCCFASQFTENLEDNQRTSELLNRHHKAVLVLPVSHAFTNAMQFYETPSHPASCDCSGHNSLLVQVQSLVSRFVEQEVIEKAETLKTPEQKAGLCIAFLSELSSKESVEERLPILVKVLQAAKPAEIDHILVALQEIFHTTKIPPEHEVGVAQLFDCLAVEQPTFALRAITVLTPLLVDGRTLCEPFLAQIVERSEDAEMQDLAHAFCSLAKLHANVGARCTYSSSLDGLKGDNEYGLYHSRAEYFYLVALAFPPQVMEELYPEAIFGLIRLYKPFEAFSSGTHLESIHVQIAKLPERYNRLNAFAMTHSDLLSVVGSALSDLIRFQKDTLRSEYQEPSEVQQEFCNSFLKVLNLVRCKAKTLPPSLKDLKNKTTLQEEVAKLHQEFMSCIRGKSISLNELISMGHKTYQLYSAIPEAGDMFTRSKLSVIKPAFLEVDPTVQFCSELRLPDPNPDGTYTLTSFYRETEQLMQERQLKSSALPKLLIEKTAELPLEQQASFFIALTKEIEVHSKYLLQIYNRMNLPLDIDSRAGLEALYEMGKVLLRKGRLSTLPNLQLHHQVLLKLGKTDEVFSLTVAMGMRSVTQGEPPAVAHCVEKARAGIDLAFKVPNADETALREAQTALAEQKRELTSLKETQAKQTDEMTRLKLLEQELNQVRQSISHWERKIAKATTSKPDELEALRQKSADLEEQVAALDLEIAAKEQEIQQLEKEYAPERDTLTCRVDVLREKIKNAPAFFTSLHKQVQQIVCPITMTLPPASQAAILRKTPASGQGMTEGQLVTLSAISPVCKDDTSHFVQLPNCGSVAHLLDSLQAKAGADSEVSEPTLQCSTLRLFEHPEALEAQLETLKTQVAKLKSNKHNTEYREALSEKFFTSLLSTMKSGLTAQTTGPIVSVLIEDLHHLLERVVKLCLTSSSTYKSLMRVSFGADRPAAYDHRVVTLSRELLKRKVQEVDPRINACLTRLEMCGTDRGHLGYGVVDDSVTADDIESYPLVIASLIAQGEPEALSTMSSHYLPRIAEYVSDILEVALELLRVRPFPTLSGEGGAGGKFKSSGSIVEV